MRSDEMSFPRTAGRGGHAARQVYRCTLYTRAGVNLAELQGDTLAELLHQVDRVVPHPHKPDEGLEYRLELHVLVEGVAHPLTFSPASGPHVRMEEAAGLERPELPPLTRWARAGIRTRRHPTFFQAAAELLELAAWELLT